MSMYSLVAMKESMNRPDSAKCGSKGVAFEHRLFRVRVCYFYLKARPAVRLWSWSEAGCAASVLERGRLGGFGLGARPARPAPGTHQARASFSGKIKGVKTFSFYRFDLWRRSIRDDPLENFGTDRQKFLHNGLRGVRRVGESHIVHIAHIAKLCTPCIVSYYPGPGQRDTKISPRPWWESEVGIPTSVRGAGAGVARPAPGRAGARDLPAAAEGEARGALQPRDGGVSTCELGGQRCGGDDA